MNGPRQRDQSAGPGLGGEPRAVRARKRPVSVAVQFADCAGMLKTLEGEVHYEAGDALLTGSHQDRWPVSREHFDRSYEALAGTQNGQSGHYRKRPLTVLARQLDAPFEVRVGEKDDALNGGPGDWLVQYGAQEFGIVSAEIFEATYEIVPDRANTEEPIR